MQIQCVNCDSYKVTTDQQTAFGVGIVLIIVGGVFSFLIFPIIFSALGVLMVTVSAFAKAKRATCNSCKYKWSL